MIIEAGLIAESVYRASAPGRHDWQKCRVIAIDDGDVIVRWLTGPDAGHISYLDDDPDFWREVNNG